MYENSELNFKILQLKLNYPDFFYDDINISAIYGNPQFCIWDGGRIFLNYNYASMNKIINLIHQYNDIYNIPIRYIFTNNQLNKEHYYDRFGNLLLEAGSNFNNEIVVALDEFGTFLKEKYPTYKIISSTTKCLNKKSLIKNELNKTLYDYVCLDYNLNYDLKFLSKLSEQEKSKIEILVNPICGKNCSFRKNHYELNSISNLNYGKPYELKKCLITGNGVDPRNINKNNNITYEDIIENYYPLNIINYKIEGRTWKPLELAITYCNYMIKPEYYGYVLSKLFEE